MFEERASSLRPVTLGRVVSTPGALQRVPQEDIVKGLARHQRHDWGELDRADRQANNRALLDRTRILSAYTAVNGTKFWIITEADRSVTTVLLPDEY